MKRWIGAFGASLLLAGCSAFGEDVPEGFTEESYEDFVNAYRTYEKAKIAHEEPNSVVDDLFEYREKAEKGELTETEMEVRDAISGLAFAYISAYQGLNNETYDIVTLTPDTLTAEIVSALSLENIKETEELVLSQLKLEPLPTDEKDEELKQSAYMESTTRVLDIAGVGSAGTPASFEDSLVVYRKERDEYYIASSFSYNGETYKYDMMLDGELSALDAYVVGSAGGLFSDPMNDDNRPELQAPANAGAGSETANEAIETPSPPAESTAEEEQSAAMESVYGADKEVEMGADGVQVDKSETSETVETPSTEPEWDKELFLGGAISETAATLETFRHINADAMSLDMDVASANEALALLGNWRDTLDLIRIDPTTTPYLSDSEKETLELLVVELTEVMEAEQQMISDPSTQNIRMADSTTEMTQGTVDQAQFNY